MTLDLSTLRRAIAALEEALRLPRTDIVRDAVVKRFEFTYELSWKFLRRSLADSAGSEAVDPLSRRDLFRLGARVGLIADSDAWFEYHRARNETSHTYDAGKAEEIAALAEPFCRDAAAMLRALEERHA